MITEGGGDCHSTAQLLTLAGIQAGWLTLRGRHYLVVASYSFLFALLTVADGALMRAGNCMQGNKTQEKYSTRHWYSFPLVENKYL